MSNEMPEKIYVGKHEDDGTLYVPRFITDFAELIEYIHHDTVAELQRQNAALKEFVMSDSVGILMRDESTKAAVEAGIAEYYQPSNTTADYRIDFASWMTDDTAALPAPSKAEVAREFVEAVGTKLKEWHDDEDDECSSYYRYVMGVVAKEWEDADNKK